MKILGLDQEKLVVLVEQCVHSLIDICNIRRDYGGYFTGFNYTGGGSGCMQTFHIGICPPEKRVKHFRLSREKVLRLYSNPHHETSYPSSDSDEGKLPGAIRIAPDIVSHSGFEDPLADEALAIIVANKAGRIDRVKMESLAVPSDNPYIREIIIGSSRNHSILLL